MKFDHDLTAETLPSKIYRILREAIIKGQLQPGERLVQDELAKTLNVSRMPIREAIKQLAAEGYVTVEPHKGAVVKQFTIHELEEIYFLRAKFEPLAAAESLKTMSSQLVNQLRNLNEKMKKTDDTDEYIQLNIQFHHLLIKDCPWGKLNNIIENLWTGFPQQTPHLLPNQIATSISEHDLMVEALANNNIELTCQLLEQHITRAKYDVLKNFIQ
ncbi:GntR family transcriptional regulator [Solibacillus sp. FSL K6-1781]|uniref:Transcriptional regulator n=1 Tax=Solibacillus silvestris (strain StLB046) TaxID=1002809 RepID=F2F241_SOLSS|nr:GntR family transcriptional regulator [Solibacillus silvestris]OBW59069.1 transcriptional regulator [Solibacillus silvestris]BAK14514.1 transcriptional regulator [Solibacillus silvestris StLB046]